MEASRVSEDVISGAGRAFRSVPTFGQTKPLVGTFAELRNSVGTFLCRGGTTTWAITPDAVIMVDSQMMDSAPVFLDGLKSRRSHQGIDAVVNTRYHGDHTGGNAVLRLQRGRGQVSGLLYLFCTCTGAFSPISRIERFRICASR